MTRPPECESFLRCGVLTGIALVLLTPFVITPSTVFPFIVGKALWSRSLIEIVIALWAPLALAYPAYRPPRSCLLALLAAGLGVSLLAAGFGVSLQRSLWSDYERMQGVVDHAHWIAFAVVLASMLRTASAWRTLLALNVGTSAALACIVMARHWGFDIPFYGMVPEQHLPRVSGPLGNPTYLSVYMLANLVVAVGFAARSWLSAHDAGAGAATSGRYGRRRPSPSPRGARRRAGPRWLPTLSWGLVAALHLAVLALAASVGGVVGLFASAVFLACACARLGQGRTRWAAAAAVAVLGLLAVGVALRVVSPVRTGAAWLSSPAARYVAHVHLQRPGVQGRLAAWEAGLEGFAARPLLGWGPGNFGAVFGRFASGYGAVTEPHDQAHGKLVEVAATTGVLGVLFYLALWSWTFVVVWRTARQPDPRDRALVLCVGAALTGGLVQSQFLFDTPVGSLQTAVLLAFVAALEPVAFPRGAGLARPWDACAALLRRRGARLATGVAAVALSVAGLAAHRSVLVAADGRHVATAPSSISSMAGGIDGFRPLANTYRWWLFNMVTVGWQELRTADEAGARRLLDWVEREADEAIRTEPERWRFQHSLAQMYRAVASTEPAYEDKARRALERARELAPNREVFPVALEPPRPVEVRRLDDGRHELRWQGSAGAGYHVVGQSREDGGWHALLHAYDPARTSFVRPRRPAPGAYRYRIRACRFPGNCTVWVDWPPITEPPGSTSLPRPTGDTPGGAPP